METILMILPIAYIALLIGIAVFFGGGDGGRTVRHKGRDDGADTVFSDLTDPAKSYLIYNIHHDDSAMEDNSYDWDDSSSMSDSTSSSMWDD